VGVTGNALPTDIDHFLAHGASKVLLKPLRMAEFNGAVEGGEVKYHAIFTTQDTCCSY
jgi:CheY-like chemotaxis protein